MGSHRLIMPVLFAVACVGVAAADPRGDHDAPGPVVVHVALNGDDAWSGALAKPNADRTDGPFATIDRARRAVRDRKAAGGPAAPVRVEIHGGTHFLAAPLRFGPDDSGAPPARDEWNKQIGPERAVVYAAAAGERPVVSGGRRITGWTKGEVAGREAWTVELPEVREGRWQFTQLWVDGRRAVRPRLPRAGPEKFGRNATYRIAEPLGVVRFEGSPDETIFTGQDAFRYSGDDLAAFHNLTDVDCVVLNFWVATRIPFERIDTASKTATLQRKSRMRLTDDFTKDGAAFYVENVREALDTPGQFYLDRVSGLLTYLPRPGEAIDTAEVIAPVLQQVMLVEGVAPEGERPARYVEWLRFEGLAFSHTEWVPGPEDALTPQAASHVPGAVVFARARHCAVRDCAVTHVGSYGLETRDACSDVEIVRNTIADLGAGGVKIWHTETAAGRPETSLDGGSRRITLADNVIADGGHRHHQGVGVLVGRCSGNTVLHNDIHDFDYTGISVGWTWGYRESYAYGNVVERNHVHDIGRGMLSDMGGIYTLGVSPGTRIRYNLFHDIDSRGYGGWGIYTDEGSSGILVESNLVYRTKSQGFHQHYGRGNVVRNNIFAFGREAAVARTRIEPHESFAFTGNIVLLDNDGRVLAGDWNETRATFDRNLYFHVGGIDRPLDFAVGDRKRGDSFVAWQRRGMDLHGLVADPLMTDPLEGDFQLDPRSPAIEKLGFVPWDYGNVGPRPRDGAAPSGR